jgi:cytochrome d ubiquinol oxidase subunit I
MHFFSTLMVFVGSVFSSVWITVANSWQQTPAGFHIVGEGPLARAEITDFWAMVFNPSSVDRLVHVWLGAFSMGGFFVMSVSAYYILKGRHLDFAKNPLRWPCCSRPPPVGANFFRPPSSPCGGPTPTRQTGGLGRTF